MSSLLPLVFFGVAVLYAMAGFGGGSSYIALLAISGLPLASIPVLALSCNLIVSTQGAIILARAGHCQRRLVIPLLAGSVPAAFVAGAWRIEALVYLWTLTVVLTLAGLALFYPVAAPAREPEPLSPVGLVLTGGSLGALAGLSGIGGGIFLSPVLHFLRAASPREIAAMAALFIAVNSTAGLLGQLTKGTERLAGIPASLYLLCPVAVLAGGWIGSRSLARHLSPRHIRQLTAVVVLLAAARLWLRLWGGY